MLNEGLFERALAWVVNQRGEAHLLEARRAFERATGSIDEAASDYELRISHFLEQYLCEGEGAPLAAFAGAHEELREDERRELAGWLRSHRSLFAFEGFHSEGGLLRDCLAGGSFRVWPSELDRQLTPGDMFDARIVPVGDLLCLSPGRVHHPRQAHESLRALLAPLARESILRPREEPRASTLSSRTATSRARLLDGLLLMRSRFLEMASVRAEHVYQAKALASLMSPTLEQEK